MISYLKNHLILYLKILIIFLVILNNISCSKKSYIDERVEEITNTPVKIDSVYNSIKMCPDPVKPDFTKYMIEVNTNTHIGDIRTSQEIKNIIRIYGLYVNDLENTLNCYKSLFNNEIVKKKEE